MKKSFYIATDIEVSEFLTWWAEINGYQNQSHLIETILEKWVSEKKEADRERNRVIQLRNEKGE